jgi:hypothetical protein
MLGKLYSALKGQGIGRRLKLAIALLGTFSQWLFATLKGIFINMYSHMFCKKVGWKNKKELWIKWNTRES